MNKPTPTVRFTKTTFTVPTDTWAQLKKLTGDKTSRGFAPILGEPGVRFSRDRYLSQLLEKELPRLEKLSINSAAARRVLTTELRDQRRDHPESFTKANLCLESDVVKRFDVISGAKRVPRDLLMSCFLELVVRGLLRARSMVLDPTSEQWFIDPSEDPYSDLHLTEDDLLERKEADLAIYSLAALKKEPIYLVKKAYWELPRAKRREIRNRPSVRAAMKKHRMDWQRGKDTPIDLTDLLPPSLRPRKLR